MKESYNIMKITDDDIEYFERHVKRNMRNGGFSAFCEHLLKLAKALKELQERNFVEYSEK